MIYIYIIYVFSVKTIVVQSFLVYCILLVGWI